MSRRYLLGIPFTAVCLFAIVLCCIVMYRQCSIDAGYSPTQHSEDGIVEVAYPEISDDAGAVVETFPTMEHEPVEAIESVDVTMPTGPTVELMPAAEPVPAGNAFDMVELEPATEVDVEPEQVEYVSRYEEIDWSQFVFSNDVLALPDGIYYTSVYVNDIYEGAVETVLSEGEAVFNRLGLAGILEPLLASSSFDEFFALEEDYYSLDNILPYVEDARFDSNSLEMHLVFSASQIPVRTISIRGSSSRSKIRSYDIMGTVDLKPASFSFISNVNFTANVQHDRSFNFVSSGASLSLSNTFSFLGVTFNLPVSVMYDKGIGLRAYIGNLYGYVDFPDRSLRLSFGGVGATGFSKGRPFGVTLEKNYSFGTDTAMLHQYSQRIELNEDSVVEILINDRTVYRKTLSFGIYLLRDFVFSQGTNDIVVKIHPVSMGDDESLDRTLVFSQDYDTSLLAKGDDVWRLGFGIPFGSGLSGLGMFWEQTIGFSHTYTQSHALSITSQRYNETGSVSLKASVSSILATGIGTTRFNFVGNASSVNGVLSDSKLSGSVSQSFSSAALKPLSLSFAFSIGQKSSSFALNAGYSFKVGSLAVGTGLSLSFSGSISSRASLSLSLPLPNGFNVSMSSSIDSSFEANATVSVSKSIGQKTGMNASASFGTNRKASTNIGLSHSVGRSSFGLSLGGFNVTDPLNHSLSASWTYRGGFAALSIREQVRNRYNMFVTSLSASTAFAFADGHFAMANNIGGPFLIVSPQSKAKDIGVVASQALNSNPRTLSNTFGNFLYTGLSLYVPNNVFVSITQGDLLASNASLYRMTPYAMQGFVASISYEALATATGVLVVDGKPYSSYSSPVYELSLEESPNSDYAEVVRTPMDIAYVFTDDAGRFIISELAPGRYMFDLNVEGGRYAVVFDVPEVEDSAMVLLFKDLVFDTAAPLSSVAPETYLPPDIANNYDGVLTMEVDGFVTEDQFWDMIFAL